MPRAEAVAGAPGVVRLLVPLGVDVRALEALLATAGRDGASSGPTRMIMCELPDDPRCASASALLLASGFVEEGRVPDYFADGVALRILVRWSTVSAER